MTNEKPWYLSKTIWASLLTIILSSSSFLDVSLGQVDQEAIIHTLVQFFTALSGIAALFGRISATTLISRKEL